MSKLHPILERVLEYYQQCEHESYIVNPALPILYFGDLAAYLNSNIKIITVGKNPSDQEFRLRNEDGYSFFRFPSWEEEQNLENALNQYFKVEPYNWFNTSYEPILEGITASYYGNKQPNIAIHTDICSPLATNPTWNKLDETIQNKLFQPGFNFWKDLVNILEPDILLVSVAKEWFEHLKLQDEETFKEFNYKKNGEARKKPYKVYQYNYLLNSKSTKVFFGEANINPFLDLDDCYKKSLGEEIFKNFRFT